MFDDLDPHGALEEALVEPIALTLWQHQRLVPFQRAAVTYQLVSWNEPWRLYGQLDPGGLTEE